MNSNWMQIEEWQNWIAYFRLYDPEVEYFEKFWVLNGFENAGSSADNELLLERPQRLRLLHQ